MNEIKAKRAKILIEADKDTELQQALIAKCKNELEGLLYWVENFVWIHEPRGKKQKIPMTFQGRNIDNKYEFEYQKQCFKEIYEAIENGTDLRIEKSRDSGWSWMVITTFTYGFLFKGWSCLVGSRKEQEVDKIGDLSKLIPKARYILERLPEWMLPEGFDLKQNMGYMNIYNPITGASITGESNNANFGTGQRKKAVLFDEYAKWLFTDQSAWISAGATTPCRIALSTPLYKTNNFYKLKKTPIKNVAVHYSENPCRNPKNEIGKKWYENERKRYSEAAWAQEYEISYEGTQHDSVYFEEIQLMKLESRIAPQVVFQRNLPLVIAMDFGMGALTSMGVYQLLGWNEEVRLISMYENSNKKIQYYIDWIKSEERPWNIDENGVYLTSEEHWKSIVIIPDPNQAPNREMQTGKSLEQVLRNAGFTVKLYPIGRLEGISEAKKVFKKLWINSELDDAVEHLSGYHYEYNEKLGEYKDEPVHDIHSHFCDQYKYLCAYLKDTKQIKNENENEVEDPEWEDEQTMKW